MRNDIKKNISKVKNITFKTRHLVFLVILLIVTIALIIDYKIGGVTQFIFSSDTASLAKFINSFGIIGPIIFISLVILEVLIAPIPGFILYLTGGVVFGWFWGAILTLGGNMIGAILCFYIAKYLGREFAKKKIDSKKMEIFDKYALKFGGYAIFLLRVNPLTSSDIVSYAAGFSNIRFRDFAVGTFFGLLPLSFAQTYFGYALTFSPKLYWAFLIISILYFFAAVYLIYSGNKRKI